MISAIAKKTSILLALLCLLVSCAQQAEVTLLPTGASLPAHTPALTPTAILVSPTTDLRASASPIVARKPLTDTLRNTFYEETKLQSDVDLALQVSASPPVGARETAVYTLTVTNLGPALARNVTLTDSLPAGATLAWFAPRRATCGFQSPLDPNLPSTLACDLGDLKGGDVATVTLDLMSEFTGGLPEVRVDLDAPSCVPSEDGSALTCHLGDLEGGAQARVLLAATVQAAITRTITNTATVATTGVDSKLSNNAVTTALVIAPGTAQTAVEEHTATDLAVWTDVPARVVVGQPFTYTLTITNNGPLDVTGLILQDILPPGLLVHEVTPREPLCTLVGDTITCQLPASDQDITFSFVVLSDVEASWGTQLDPVSPGWPLCDVEQTEHTSHAIYCYLGDLASGQKTHVTFVATASGAMARTITNTVAVRANEADFNLENNAQRVGTTVGLEAGLSVRSQASGLAIPGRALTYTLTITNAGPSDARGVVITNTLPPSVTLVSAQRDQTDTCFQHAVLSDVVSCHLDRLESGQRTTVVIAVMVSTALDPSLVEAITSTVVVVGDLPDPDYGDNEASAPTHVGFRADLTIMTLEFP